mgnify:CR=1 FL=1
MYSASAKQTAERFHISERRVQKLCEAGRIEGAQLINNVWAIPVSAEKPADERFSIEIDDMLSLSDVCTELSISIATGRNWVKLGKLLPSKTVKRTPYFEKDYIAKIKIDLISGKNQALKSRRNKKFVSGNSLYHAYVSSSSKNIPVIQSLIDFIQEKGLAIDNSVITASLYLCAKQLLEAKFTKEADAEVYGFLLDDLIASIPSAFTVIASYPELSDCVYEYEPFEDILGLLYISLTNIGSRKATGSYYTPTSVVKKLCDSLTLDNDSTGKTIFDPCCGTGNFILQLPDSFDGSNVYGNDIDPVSVRIARINYALKYGITNREIIYAHITESDYLSFSLDAKYDFIIGNPPWGCEFSSNAKLHLQNRYQCATGNNVESYDMFVEQAILNLRTNGILAFVLPEAFLNVKAHAPIRQFLLDGNSIQSIDFIGNAFDKVQCPCIILQLIHTGRPFSTIGLKINTGSRRFVIQSNRKITADNFPLTISDEEYDLLNKIDSVPQKTTLKNNSIFALGIVTGNNKEYLSTSKNDKNEIILKGSDLHKYRFDRPNNYIVFRPESFQQTAPTEYYRAKEKLFYRFICNQLVFAYDNSQMLSLNSCNVLIPQIPSLNIKYVLAVLNSRVAQFYFKKQFNSVKVLRSHIEQIPIPYADDMTQKRIITAVDFMHNASSEYEILKLYEAIDAMIAEIFKLSRAEYDAVTQALSGENLFLL